MSTGNVITFYSYKGGVGRTFLLANVAVLLARWGLRVLCVDWDLEAPGLHLYFEGQQSAESGRSHPGMVELFAGYRRGRPLKWRDHVQKVLIKDAVHAIDFISAGVRDDSYEGRLQRLDWERLFEKSGLGLALEAMRDEWKQDYDLILLDSRTGVTDIGGICTILFPDTLVLVGTASRQSMQGLLRIADLADRGRASLEVDRGLLRVLPVLSRYEARVEVVRGQRWLTEFHTAFDPWVRRWISEGTSVPDLLNHIRIPHVPFWAFGEELAVVEEGTSDPESVSYAIETLAALLQHGLDDAGRLLSARDAYVAESADASNPFPVDILLLYAGSEVELARSLDAALTEQGSRTQVHALAEPMLGERFREARNLVFVVGEKLPPKEDSNASTYIRRFYSERPPVGRIVPVLQGDKLPDALSNFGSIMAGSRRGRELAILVSEALATRGYSRIPRAANPDLWRPVEVEIVQFSDGLGIQGGGPFVAEVEDAGLRLRGRSVKHKDALLLPWRSLKGAGWWWEWLEPEHREDEGWHRLELHLNVADRLGVVAFHSLRLTARSEYELQRLRRQIEATLRWPRSDPGSAVLGTSGPGLEIPF